MADKATFSLDSDDPYLSPDERKVVKRLLSHPEDFPQEFWSAVTQKVALDGEPIPQSQVQGLSQFRANHASVSTSPSSETTTSTSYTDLATVGPTISGLADGSYLILVSAWMFNDGGGTPVSMMVPFVNGVSSGDTAAAFTSAGPQGGTFMNASTANLQNNNNNTVQAKYRVNSASTGTFNYRNLIVLRIGN